MNRSDKRWNATIVALWITVFGWAMIAQSVPATLWFEVERVFVHDGVALEPPPMDIDRDIKRPFHADWTVTIMREGASGFFTFCTAHGRNDYRPENQLPDVLDLDWWTWPYQCALPSGRYYLNTVWEIHTDLFPPKYLRNQSNLFEMVDP